MLGETLKIRVGLTEWPANFSEPNIRIVKTEDLSKKIDQAIKIIYY